MTAESSSFVRDRANNCCEYSLLPQIYLLLPFQVDHVIAKQHGGTSVAENLALACPLCNRHKGPNIAGYDVETFKIVRLFNPRVDDWRSHFEYAGPLIIGKTEIGRVTVQTLAINSIDQLTIRSGLLG